MRNNKLIYLALLWLTGLTSCADNDNNNPDIDTGDGQVHLQATVAKNNVLTRDKSTSPAEAGDFYLYYTKVGETSLSTNKFTLSGSTWTADPALYWDDIEQTAPNTKVQFTLTNMENRTFTPKIVNQDILYGKTTGWNETLNFTLDHLTAKITVIVYDNTLNENVNFSNAKVVFSPGLNKTTTGIDFTNGSIISLPADKEATTTIIRTDFTPKDNISIGSDTFKGVESAALYIVPHTFNENDSLEVTAGTYVYRIPVPIPTGKSYPYKLEAGEHLTIQAQLSEDVISANAKLTDWVSETIENPIEVSRVFNIASWNELRDLAQAVATGYTFKGMVVRLTDNIELQDQISLGTEEYPFEGVFSGGGKRITNLGIQVNGTRRNKGGLFGYTSGATIQDVILVAPYVEPNGDNPVGALIDMATNTTVFNCSTESVDENAGEVKGGTVENVGGLIGTATGTSTLLNCYSHVRVEGTGEFIGGLIGYSEASITHCYAKGEVDCPGATHVGGLAGSMYGSMRYCYAQGNVTGDTKVGGLVGHLEGKVDQCYASGKATGTEAGGLVNCLGFNAVVENSFWHFQNAKGSGTATLSESCDEFTNGTDLLGFLGNTDIWTMGTTYPEFANQ